MGANVLNLLLAHQDAVTCKGVIQRAAAIASGGTLLLAHGGRAADFQQIHHNPKIFIEDDRLRTRDHQRETQSYSGIFRAVADWMKGRSFEFIHFFEYDHLPLVADLNARQIARLEAESADILGYHLARIDGTSHPHFLHYAASSEFRDFFGRLSHRSDPDAVLSMLVTGSIWRREAFDAVAEVEEPQPLYFEVYLPTVAHHLGFRIRDYGEQGQFVLAGGDWSRKMEDAKRKGAWTLHPVKKL